MAIDLTTTYTNKATDDKETNKTPYSEFNVSKHLYEARLGNVFSDYQKNQEYLKQEKRESLQDAYFIKEMSKKYLGQYASNVGAGDVSGNLTDIYSNYQSNVKDIDKGYGEESFKLAQQYQAKRQEALEGILTSQYGLELERMQETSQNVFFNVVRGDTGGLSDIEYLDKALAEGDLDPSTHRAFVMSLYEQNEKEIFENIEQGFYGFRYENGERVLNTNPADYIEQNKENITPKSYNALLERAELLNVLHEATQLTDITNPQITDSSGQVVDNPNYIGDNYNFEVEVPDINVDPRTTIGFQDSQGNRFFSHKQPVDKDTFYDTKSEDLYNEFLVNSDDDNKIPNNGDIVSVIAKDQRDGVKKPVSYIFNNDQWYRLGQEQKVKLNDMRFMEGEEKRKWLGVGREYYTLTYGKTKYEQDENDYFDIKGTKHDEKEIVSIFETAHGEINDIPDGKIVFYHGDFYVKQENKIYKMERIGNVR
jgi:hypothetical protein